MSPIRKAAILFLVTAVMAGCQHKAYRREPPVIQQQPQPYYLQPGQPIPTQPAQPFLGTPVVPPSPDPIQPAESEMLLPEPLPDGPSPVIESGRNRADEKPRRRFSGVVRLGRPIFGNNEDPREVTRLEKPPADPAPPAVIRGASPDDGESPVGSVPPSVPLFPAGIPNFSPAYESVASGQRPDLGGLEWLKANRYHTVLRLLTPEVDDVADQRLTERLGFTYSPVVIDPAKPMTAIERFNSIVSEPENRPLFVYDLDGSLAGPMWYAHFRSVAKLPDADAIERASRLGLDPEAPAQATLLQTIRRDLEAAGS